MCKNRDKCGDNCNCDEFVGQWYGNGKTTTIVGINYPVITCDQGVSLRIDLVSYNLYRLAYLKPGAVAAVILYGIREENKITTVPGSLNVPSGNSLVEEFSTYELKGNKLINLSVQSSKDGSNVFTIISSDIAFKKSC